jgi:hypothetical protein
VCTTVSALEDKQNCVKDLGWQGWSSDGAHPAVQMEMQQKHYWRRPGPKPRLRTTNRLHARLAGDGMVVRSGTWSATGRILVERAKCMSS